ncbi:dicarboxylate transport [Nitrosomonas sp. Nm84]|uniref:intermembrane phospholipid transport protein YdbH family protein n=1 Tax=Nitrosomonas sp. Nm84 TaxID=200124 RepID=UPI000D7588E6|nr:YdbH domain-containing protein [Nitrosomonas sp. Nm84]PXW88382.1 dicarboxylate transport [Nitrosomonas sp. Nm84]
MGKQLTIGLLVLISLIMFAGVGLYAFRHSLLEALINDQLRKQGLPLQSIAVEEFSFSTLRLHDLAAGNNKELRVDKILVTWDLQDLLAEKPISVEISGLKVVFDLNRERSPVNSLQPMTSASGTDINIAWLPVFSLKDSTIHLHSTAGDAMIALSGDIAQNQPGARVIRLNTITTGSLGQAKVMLTATLDAQGNVQGKLTVADGMLNIPEAKISSFTGETAFTLAALQLQHARTEFMLSGIKLQAKESEKPVSAPADENPAALSLRDAAIHHIALKGDIRGLPNAWTGELDVAVDGGQLAADSLNIQQLSIALPLQINSSQDIWRIGLRNPGQVTLGKIESDYPLRFQNAPGLAISQANLELVKKPQGFTLKHDIAVVPSNLTLHAERTGSPTTEIQVRPGKIALTGEFDTHKEYRGQLVINDTALHLPQSHLQVQNISAIVHVNDTEIGNAADFAIGRLQHLAPEPLFATLSISGNIRNKAADGKPAVYALDVTGGLPSLPYLKVTGRHEPSSGNGTLKAEITPLKFSPHKLQPGALSPALAQLEDVSGQISVSTQFKWSTKGMRTSRGTFELHNMSFAREAVKVNDLNVTLNLDNLLALSSPPRQTITIRRIDAGIPLENLLISYRIIGADSPRIALEKAQFSMMDGVVSVVPTVIDPAAAHSDMLIQINNIDLETFFNLIKVDGLVGSGHLDGQIPFTLENNQVTITNGHLVAKAPGTLHFKSEKASQLLTSAGDEMNLLLQAMEDFHYTELSLNLDKSVTHDLVVKFSMLGNNPKIKDGQAFRLNIKLETNIDKILQAINQGYSLSHEILRSSFKLY